MSEFRRILFALVVVLGCAVLTAQHVHAFGLGDLNVQVSSADTSGNNSCVGLNVQSAINRLTSGYAQQFIKEVLDEFKDPIFDAQIALCIAANLHLFGTGSGGLTCSYGLGSLAAAVAKITVLNKLKGDFLSNCTARNYLDTAMDDGRRILNENGRDGGPVWVQDWQQFQANSSYRGLQVARNQMANTYYCPWLQGTMQGYFNFDPNNAVNLTNEYENGFGSYTQSAQCSLPDGFDPTNPQYDTADALFALSMPQNNAWGSYLLAQGNVAKQVQDAQQADQNEFVYTGGLGALHQQTTTGTGCAVMAPDGSTCLQYSRIIQSEGGVQAEVQAQRQASYDWLNNSRQANSVMGDVRTQIVSSLLDYTVPALGFQYGLDAGGQDIANNPTPLPTAVPAACFNIPAQCVCIAGDPSVIALGNAIGQSVQAATLQHPELVTADRSHVLPGSEALFLQVVCQTNLGTALGCTAAPGSLSQVMIPGGGSNIMITVIGSGNTVLAPAQVVDACPVTP